MSLVFTKTAVIKDSPANKVSQEVSSATHPVILKGLVSAWALVSEGLVSDRRAIDYLRKFDVGLQVGAFFGGPEIGGRYGYKADLSGLNFFKRHAPLAEILDRIQAHLENGRPPAIYVGSSTVDACLPGLRDGNDVRFEESGIAPLMSIWLGNPSTVGCHFDAPTNLACCVVGHRRFTLFPPEQIHNLYPGPLEPTPGGQVTSMVDLAAPDFERYPRAREALAAGQIAELEPGDAIFIPSMWWHQVEGLDRFNVLINYWWSTSPKFMGTPMNAVYHALLSLRDRPEHERQAWKEVFDYYIFGGSDRSSEHLPAHARGLLGELDELKARQLRAYLLNGLNR